MNLNHYRGERVLKLYKFQEKYSVKNPSLETMLSILDAYKDNEESDRQYKQMEGFGGFQEIDKFNSLVTVHIL